MNYDGFREDEGEGQATANALGKALRYLVNWVRERGEEGDCSGLPLSFRLFPFLSLYDTERQAHRCAIHSTGWLTASDDGTVNEDFQG